MTNRTALLSAVCLLCLAVPAGAQVAGVTAAVNQSATGVPPGGTIRTVVLGDNVVRNERIDTNSIGLVQILLADGTAFTVGPDSSVTIDSFVYDPDAGTAQVAATMTRGVLRFIGGRTSKTPNGVSLATPIGTVGIRGAVVDVNLVGSTADSCGLPAHIDLVFGQEVTLSGGGAPARVYQPGYSIVADGRQGRRVQRTPPGCASLVQSALAGRPGTTGGASEPPTETIVAQSPIGAQNSARPVAFNAPPIPTARPVNPNTVDAILVADATLDLVRIRIAQGLPPVAPEPEPPVVEPEPEPPVVEPPVIEPPVEPEPPVVVPPVEPPVDPEPEPPVVEPEPPVVPPVDPEETVTFNVYQNPISDADSLFFVSDDPTETTATRTSQGSDSRLVGELQSGESDAIPYDLPYYTDAALPDSSGAMLGRELVGTPGPSTPGGMRSAEFGGEPLDGITYVGSGGFRAYLLRTSGAANDGGGEEEAGSEPVLLAAVPPPSLFYAIAGTATPSTTFEASEVRQYRIDDDRAFALFAPPSNEFDGASSLYVVGGEAPRIFQADLSIVAGEGQRSEISVNVGQLIPQQSGGGWTIEGEHRGGLRASDSNSLATFGTFASLQNAEGSGFFGTDGDYAVLTGTPGEPSPFTSASSDPTRQSDSSYNQTVVLSRLGEEAPLSDGRFAGSYGGYTAGLVEQRQTFSNGSIAGDSVFQTRRNRAPDQTSLTFTGTAVSGQIAFSSDGGFPVPPISILVGEDGDESAFVDNDLYAAVGENAAYILSGRATPFSFPSDDEGSDRPFDLCTSCEFIQWGWWGTQRETSSGESELSEITREGVHLGNYVTGDLTSTSEYDTFRSVAATSTTGTIATYTGNAVGTVLSGSDTRVATGSFTLGWDFGEEPEQAGGLDLMFDGQRFISNLNLRTDSGVASFTGSGGQPNLESPQAVPGSAISVDGSFVNAPGLPLGGVIGSFDASVGGWQGNGIFGGAQQGGLTSNDVPMAPQPPPPPLL